MELAEGNKLLIDMKINVKFLEAFNFLGAFTVKVLQEQNSRVSYVESYLETLYENGGSSKCLE